MLEASAIEINPALAPWAMRAEDSRGRRHPEPAHPYRSEYARDRDRIIHARAFRRLEAKTQVFTARFSDHFRNRLTHTLEVSQIGRTVALALSLNTELVEALSLVHDIGHPPFGHAGERKLDELMRQCSARFDHNLHALRIVEQFEHRYLGFAGLNLTLEVREGIVKHSREYSAAEFPELAEYLFNLRPPLESQLIDWVDEIAYNTADLDDALEANLLDLELLCREVPFFGEIFDKVSANHPQAPAKLKFSEALRHMLDFLVTDLVENTKRQIHDSGVQKVDDVRRARTRLAGLSEIARGENSKLKNFLFAHVYNHPLITEDSERSVLCLGQLFNFYLQNPHSMPETHEEMAQTTPRHVIVCDYIAGMTDQFLLKQYQQHFDAPPASDSSIARP